MKIHEKESRYHEYQSVEKGTPCGLYHGIAEIADFPGQQGIGRPEYGRSYSKQIAKGIQAAEAANEKDTIAMMKPRKNRFPGFSSFFSRKEKIAVKNGAMEMITPTLEA